MAVISVQQNEISVRQNESTKQLTTVATIFLPLSFIAGFFGMNFGWLVANTTSFRDFFLFGLLPLPRLLPHPVRLVPPQRLPRVEVGASAATASEDLLS